MHSAKLEFSDESRRALKAHSKSDFFSQLRSLRALSYSMREEFFDRRYESATEHFAEIEGSLSSLNLSGLFELQRKAIQETLSSQESDWRAVARFDNFDEALATLESERRKVCLEPLIPASVFVPVTTACLLLLLGGIYYYMNLPLKDWDARFFSGVKLTGVLLGEENVEKVDHEWTYLPPIRALSKGDYSVIFSSCLVLSEKQEVEFELGSDDGSRLKVAGRQVVSMWKDQAYTTDTGSIELDKGRHPIVVEYYQKQGGAQLSLKADFGKGMAPIPDEMLVNPRELDGGC